MSISKIVKEPKTTVASGILAMCNFVKELEDSGEYVNATLAMGEWWKGIGIRPDVNKLPVKEKAAILARAGALSGWLGSMRQAAGSQEMAKDLISEGATLFQSADDLQNWADARSDLAICYWREGAVDEARVILQDVLSSEPRLSSELEAKILLRSVTVEISAKHFEAASGLLDRAASLIETKGSPLLRGKLYFYRASTLRSQGEDQNKKELLKAAVKEYERAGEFYKKAKHHLYCANVETNLGNLFRLLGDPKETHSHLDKAIYLYVKLRDQSRAASVYDNKARAFMAENNLKDAEYAARNSVSMLREGGEQAVLAESLITLGTVLGRQGNFADAVHSFVEAKDAALAVGDRESAGSAVLPQLEELQSDLSSSVIRLLYLEADELLKNSAKMSTLDRLNTIARRQFEAVPAET